MQKYKMTRLAAYLVVAAGLAACGANGGDGDGDGSGGGGGGGGGAGSACTPDAGVICTVQETLDDLTNGTPLTPVQELIEALLDPSSGGLAALTGPLDDVTSSGEALAQLNELVQALASQDDSALTPVIDALNGILSGANSGGAPVDASQLCALPGIGPQLASATGTTCEGGSGDTPLDASQLCALPAIGQQLAEAAGATCDGSGDGGSGDSSGLISTVQDTLDSLTGGTPLQPVQDLVNTLVDPDAGALEALTSQLEAVTSDAEALAQLNSLVEALAGENNSALTPLLTTLNSVLLAGGGEGVPGLPSIPGTDGGVPVIGDIVASLNDALPANPLTDALCGLLGC